MVDGVFHRSAATDCVDADRREQLAQRDVVPVADDLVELAFQLAGAVHPQAGEEGCAAADGLGQRRQQLTPVDLMVPAELLHDIGQVADAHQQEDGTEDGAQGGEGLVPLLGALLLRSGDIRVGDRLAALAGGGALCGAGVLCVAVAGGVGVGLLLFLSIPVDGAQDEEQDTQPRRHGEQHQQKDGGEMGKEMVAAFWLHGANSS